MEFLDKISTSMGMVPIQDSQAQDRCYKYMKSAVDTLDKEISASGGDDSHTTEPGQPPGEDPVSLLKNQKKMIISQIGFLEPNAGGHSKYKAQAFWQGWDKSKESIVKTVLWIENGHEHVGRDIIFNKLDELEDGRYKE